MPVHRTHQAGSWKAAQIEWRTAMKPIKLEDYASRYEYVTM
jgi:hypothetical protein